MSFFTDALLKQHLIIPEQLELKSFDAGADDYIIKPFDTDKLLAKMKMLLKRRER